MGRHAQRMCRQAAHWTGCSRRPTSWPHVRGKVQAQRCLTCAALGLRFVSALRRMRSHERRLRGWLAQRWVLRAHGGSAHAQSRLGPASAAISGERDWSS